MVMGPQHLFNFIRWYIIYQQSVEEQCESIVDKITRMELINKFRYKFKLFTCHRIGIKYSTSEMTL